MAVLPRYHLKAFYKMVAEKYIIFNIALIINL